MWLNCKVNCILDCIKRSIASRSREENLLPYSVLVWSYLVYCIQMWSPQHRKDIDSLEHVRRRATKMMQRMEHFHYEDMLRELGLFSPEQRMLWGDLRVAFQYLKGSYKEEGDRLFSRVCCDRTRGNGFKLKEGRLRLDIRKKVFTVRVVRHCTGCPERWWMSLATSKVRLVWALST